MSECSCPSALEAVKAARDLLENVTPLPTDCGAFCSAACCKDDPDYETSGMLLFPGEEALYDNPAAKMWMALSPSGLAGLSPEFVSAVKQALRILWAQPEQRAYLYTLTEHLKEYEWL